MDGALGLHVDDFLGAGEMINSLKDIQIDAAGACETFQQRAHHLSKRFRFASWDFGDKMRFCDAELQQSPDLEVQDDYCTEKEYRLL